MYWGSRGASSKIEQANMDGSARKVLVSFGLNWVSSLALDYQSRLLYWCDALLGKIERVDLQGGKRELILDLSLAKVQLFGLALSGDVLYWSDWNTKSVYQYSMKSSLHKVVVQGMSRPMGLIIFDHTEINGMYVSRSLISKKLSAFYSYRETSCSAEKIRWNTHSH